MDVPILKRLMLGSIFSLISCFVLAADLSFVQYTKLAKTDPQVLIDLLSSTEPEHKQLAKAEYFLLLSNAYKGLSQAEQAVTFAEQGLALPDLAQQNPLFYHQLQLARALAYDIAGVPGKALTETNTALQWSEANQQTNLLLLALVSRGSLNISLVNYIEALQDLNRAYQLASDMPNAETHQAEVAGLIALVYEYRREDALAIPYFAEAAAYHRSEQSWLELSVALYGLGRAEKNVGNQEQGLYWLLESATLARQVDDWQGVAYAEKEIAGIELGKGNIDQAIARFTAALDIFAKANNPYMQLDVNLSLARIALLQENGALAKQYLRQAEQFSDAESMPIQTLAIQRTQAAILAKQGEYEPAYQLMLEIQRRKQQLDHQQSSQQLHQLRVKYDVDTQLAENKLLAQVNELNNLVLSSQNQRYGFLLSVLLLSFAVILLFMLLYYRGRKHRQHLEQLADTDGLTAVYNRRKIMQLFQQQFEQAERYNLPLSIAVLDLDWFKQINDTFGHQTGDEVLWRFAALCKHKLRKTDFIGRIGGEEFLIVFPSTNLVAAERLTKRLCLKTRELEESLAKPGLTVSVSIGLACNTQRFSINEFLAAADDALYAAKKAGRDQVKRAKTAELI